MNNLVLDLKEYLEEKVNQALLNLETSAKCSKVENPEEMLQKLLNAALKNEWETAQLSAQWALDEKNQKFSVLLMRLAGDEAKHYMMIEKYLKTPVPTEAADSPLYNYLIALKGTFERVVAGPFTREFLAVKRNKLFLDYCEKYHFPEVMETYHLIQEEEGFHHSLGVEQLEILLKDEHLLQQAKSVIDKVLKVVDEMQEMVMLKKGLHYLPGC